LSDTINQNQMKPSPPNNLTYYRSLTRKLIFTVIIVSFTPLILVTGVILKQFYSSYQEKVYAHLGELVLKHKQNIDGFLNEKLSDIRFLASAYTLEELQKEPFLRSKLAELQQEYGPVFQDLGVIDENGNQLAYAGPFNLSNARYAEADWFKHAIKSEFYISDVFLGLRGLPHFIVAVKRKTGETQWLLRATIDFNSFNTLVENLLVGKTGLAFILNQDGVLQTTPHFEILDVMPDENTYRYFLRNKSKAKDDIHIVKKRSRAERNNIYVAAFLKNGDWLLIYQQDTADAFADLKRTQKIAVLIFLTGGLGIIVMAVLLSRRMVNRMAQSDREKEIMNRQVIETGKLASIGELAAGIAHEINNPVAIMVEEAGWIQDLLGDEDFKESENLNEFKRALLQIHIQGKRCKEITHKLLSFARKTDSLVQDAHINALIEEVVGISAQRARYSNVAIHTDLDKNLPLTEISPTEFQQVFLNLINNALDAMGKKGGVLNIASRFENGHIIIQVSDSGPGIPPEILSKIFNPFFTTKPVGKGSGLGLSICYGIIKKMGGEIDVQSIEGAGATFTVKIPLPDSGPSASDNFPSQSARKGEA